MTIRHSRVAAVFFAVSLFVLTLGRVRADQLPPPNSLPPLESISPWGDDSQQQASSKSSGHSRKKSGSKKKGSKKGKKKSKSTRKKKKKSAELTPDVDPGGEGASQASF